MSGRVRWGLPAILVVLFAACVAHAAIIVIDEALFAHVESIPVVDNQIHPQIATSGSDTEWHPLYPQESLMETLHTPLPFRLRPGSSEAVRAWRALWDYGHSDLAADHAREGIEAKRAAKRIRGEAYPSWVLDEAGIQIALANRARLGPGIAAPRFRWVAFADSLLFPLGTGKGDPTSVEQKVYLEAVGRFAPMQGKAPGTLPQYLEEVVSPALARMKEEGAVAIKLEGLPLRRPGQRALDEFEARAIYAKYAWGGDPPANEYEDLRTFLVRFTAIEASRQGMVVHLHSGTGLGATLGLRGGQPSDLGWLLDDTQVGWTNFVLVQGGWPFTAEVAALLAKPNVYADISAQSYALSPPALAAAIRPWLELYPEKILFGSGALPLTNELGWEELAWVAVSNARRALTMALADMIEEKVVSRDRAYAIARMVLHDNAVALYKLGG
jgi:predicted TIM-barrel fold metal-dependent hydrolase